KRKNGAENGEEKTEEDQDFATAVLRAKRASAVAQRPSQYCQLLVELPPTSNSCERLFSKAKLVLSPQRASLLPVNFEMLMFLRANRSYWDVTTVQEVFQQM
ncbi:hypothetical protein L914_19236, partial [Phytophthora nicotianae]